MKRTLAVMALLGAVGLANAQTIENPILKKLVEKGILKEDEAAAIDEQLAQEEAEKAKYQAEIDKTAMEAKEKLAKLEKQGSMSSLLTGKFKKFEIGGKAYLGYTYQTTKKKYTGINDSGDFEARRFYFDTKAYISDKDYIRFTTDLAQENNVGSTDKSLKLKIKYGYLYKDISDLIPHTGFEFGIVHTPWIDYEEHSGWWYRSIDKTFMESSDGMGLWPSADLGINFKTKTPYVTSEVGMFNGEGYDKINTSSKNSSSFHNSFEGRVTYHVFGNGDKKVNPTKDQYANISLHLASNIGYNDNNNGTYTNHTNLNLYHIHAVYNHPMFLIAAQYAKTDYNSSSQQAGDGYSINAEVRPVQDWSIFGRYDHWKFKKELTLGKDAQNNDVKANKRDAYYFGVAYTMNKYVKWIANVINYDYKGTNPDNKDKTKYMITAELSW
ncbi:MAG TPA: hypothetical protein DEA57_05990 [Sulfurihydrogenibium sp.]|uniref:hypothetical protein n=1 Tax=Sulfurihydrogenibium sp. (strain YO3AOP1) TaxID=436114 RepID=UPI0001723C59|nr:hypothetical protein [Sulfurihydrogenibium sp. YO3AOP1]ACD66373.1 hypothetical protein SYO3AOP1_0740 [Sulfurihydrogenibium sp. YO3AOP1]HBT99005.1 hypothetical protein [Sulfurihydrogenibium sp.]